MPEELRRVTLETMDNGGALEEFNAELTRAIADCLDPNSNAKGTRRVTLTVSLKPTEDRSSAAMQYVVGTKLAGSKPGELLVFIGKEAGEAVAYDRIQHVAFPAAVHPINGAKGA